MSATAWLLCKTSDRDISTRSSISPLALMYPPLSSLTPPPSTYIFPLRRAPSTPTPPTCPASHPPIHVFGRTQTFPAPEQAHHNQPNPNQSTRANQPNSTHPTQPNRRFPKARSARATPVSWKETSSLPIAGARCSTSTTRTSPTSCVGEPKTLSLSLSLSCLRIWVGFEYCTGAAGPAQDTCIGAVVLR